jgi:hypothetical protein
MPASQDIIMLPSIKVQKYHDGGWVWNEPAWAPDSITGPPETGGLQFLGIGETHHHKIPWEAQDRPILINGQYAGINGTWVLKVKVGDNVNNCIEYTPQQNAGTFELVIPALGANNAAWVWYSAYVHTPLGPFGGLVHVQNCMWISTV